ncbi:MAG: hypothetical protein A2987_02030 [Omnitrophica bacterium RIFCSPLOWO2_01_FULL_45_10]|nr:MAG: hypothetical protein A2987_02030 [Omnitrophica bacterium RIFCSPLOWO2_01_FULL_45_10]
MLKGNILLGLFLAIGLCLSPPKANAAGLSTGFSEVKIENLEIGKSYSTKETVGLPLVVVNTGDEPVDLKMELLLPQESELKEGFEPIPDLSWIRLERTEFKEIEPNEHATSDVIISIPPDPRYQGKKYQVFIWSHTVGGRIGVGLKSKLLFTIAKAKENE